MNRCSVAVVRPYTLGHVEPVKDRARGSSPACGLRLTPSTVIHGLVSALDGTPVVFACRADNPVEYDPLQPPSRPQATPTAFDS